MRIGILTQSMAANYGCNLQAYALQTSLERLGHEVEILDRWDECANMPHRNHIINKLRRFFKDCVKFILLRPIYHAIDEKKRPYFWQHFLRFQKENLHLTKKLRSSTEMKAYTSQYRFDAYVVGSDQVWRPTYNLGDKLFDMYLAFADGQQVKRLSYAASFGVDKWEYSDDQTRICSELAKQFDAISIREKSGVKLCADNLGVDAIHVLDPTMLLDPSDYNKLIGKQISDKTTGGLFCYILDSSAQSLQTIDYVEQTTGLKRFTCLPLVPENTYNVFHKKNSILPSPEEWLRCFRNAEMVLVDSFHGMVFSIIYNKPFWVIENSKRGMSRFQSLLSLFGLENRLVTVEQIRCVELTQPIEWESINALRLELKEKSIEYLIRALQK